jgi:hypothetical protein
MSNNAPKTTEIGAQAVIDLFERREAKKNDKPGMASVSEAKRDEMRRMMVLFHTPVNRRDNRLCMYCLVLEARERYAANYAEHLLTQKLYPEHKFAIWNGIACCAYCNEGRGVYGRYAACIMHTAAGVLQFIGKPQKDLPTLWFGRLLAPAAMDADGQQVWKGYGDHVGEWLNIPFEAAEAADLRNNVELKEAV